MRHRNPFIVATVSTLVLLPAGAFAAVRSVNEAESTLTLADGPTWYRYGTGDDLDIDPAGTDAYDNTVMNGSGEVVLDSVGALGIPGSTHPDAAVPWWDAAWQARQCSVVAGTGTQFVDIPFDSSSPAGWAASGWTQADYGDLVPVAYDGTTATTPEFWLATPFDGPDGRVFVEVDFSAASPQTICLYLGHDTGGQTSASDAQLGQNWTGLQPIYELVNPNHSSADVVVTNPTLAPVTIATSAGGAGSVVVAPGAVVTYPLGGSTTLFADGAVITRGPSPSISDESLTPLFHQGTSFVSATNRGRQNWCFAGAAGTSITVDPSNGGPVTFAHDPAAPCHQVDTNAHTVITASAPVSVFHVTHNRQDPHVLYPATDDPLYGVPSSWLKLGVDAAGNVEVASSNAAATTLAVAANGYQSNNLGGLGNAPAYRLTPLAGQELGAIQQRDDNGTDSTSFLPIEALSSRYVLPLASTYVAIACPNAGDTILVDGVARTCAASGAGEIGKVRIGATAAGVVIESASGSAFQLYYHPPNDETNVFIPRLSWAMTEGVPGAIEEPAGNGTWTATRSVTTDVWGLFDATATVPAGTTLTWEAACAATTAGPFTYVAIVLGDPLPHECDQFDVVSIRATLSTTIAGVTPTVVSADVEHDLVPDAAEVVTRDLTQAGRTWLWRIHDGTGEYSTVSTDVAPGLASTGDYVVSLVDNAMADSAQVTASGGAMADAGGADVQLHISSIVADATVLPTGSDLTVWSTTSGPSIARTIVLD